MLVRWGITFHTIRVVNYIKIDEMLDERPNYQKNYEFMELFQTSVNAKIT